jgi:hypothetical protein
MNKVTSANERITHEAGNDEAWICICNNTPVSHGFYPCDMTGKEVEPVRGWEGLYVCNKCGRIIDQKTLEVVGRRKQTTERERRPVQKYD